MGQAPQIVPFEAAQSGQLGLFSVGSEQIDHARHIVVGPGGPGQLHVGGVDEMLAALLGELGLDFLILSFLSGGQGLGCFDCREVAQRFDVAFDFVGQCLSLRRLLDRVFAARLCLVTQFFRLFLAFHRLSPLGEIVPQEAAQDEQDEYRGKTDSQQPGGSGTAAGPLAQAFQTAGAAGLDRFACRPAVEVFGQGLGRGVAPLRLPFQTLHADGLQILIDARIERAGPARLAAQHLQQRLHGRLGPEGRPAREQFKEDRPEAVGIGCRRQALARRRLLGGHVARRANDGP